MGWKLLRAEPACFLYEDPATGEFSRLLVDTDDFLFTPTAPKLLGRLIAKLFYEWDVTEQAPL